MKFIFLFLVSGMSACAVLEPAATVTISKVGRTYDLTAADTDKTIIHLDSRIYLDFDLNGSNRISIQPGASRLLAVGIAPGWHYADVIGANMWVRGLPVYISGGDEVSFVVDDNLLSVDGRTFFGARTSKSTLYPFQPSLSLTCKGCSTEPLLKFDGQQVEYTPPWVSVDAGYHTVEIYSPFDRVQMYYRALFDNFTVTEFDLFPVRMN